MSVNGDPGRGPGSMAAPWPTGGPTDRSAQPPPGSTADLPSSQRPARSSGVVPRPRSSENTSAASSTLSAASTGTRPADHSQGGRTPGTQDSSQPARPAAGADADCRPRTRSNTQEDAASKPTRRELLATLLEDPTSSLAARVYHTFMALFILFSTLAFCLETVPALSATPDQQRTWFALEVFIAIVFTIEYLIRVYCASNRRKFVLRFFSIIDLLAIAPFYIGLIVYFAAGSSSNDLAIFMVLRALRLLRTLRIFLVARYARQSALLGEAYYRSRYGIGLLFFFVTLAMIFFAAGIFMAETAYCYLLNGVWYYNADTSMPDERTPFQSIPASFWWAVVTLTTVGYGDAYPITWGGKLVASFTMVTGLIAIAFPATLIGLHLNEVYQEHRAELAEHDRVRAEDRAPPPTLATATVGPPSGPMSAAEQVQAAILEAKRLHLAMHVELELVLSHMTTLNTLQKELDIALTHLRRRHRAMERKKSRTTPAP